MADVTDLQKNDIVQFQHRHYVLILLGVGLIVPTIVAGLGWGDWRGGFYYAGFVRLLFVQHVSSLDEA